MTSNTNSKSGRPARIAAVLAIAAAAIFAAVAAYGFQAFGQEGSFDSNLHQFLMRSDSSLLKITRIQVSEDIGKRFESYSFASSNPVLYQYISSLDKSSSPGREGESELQAAHIEVAISDAQTSEVMRVISPELQESSSDYDVYAKDIAVGRGHYSIILMSPK